MNKKSLAIIILLVLAIQIIFISLPMVGYHNWKSTHYLVQSRNFAIEGNPNFFPRGYLDPNDNYTGNSADVFPLFPIVVGTCFSLFGENLVVARSVGIIFHLLCIIVFYFIMKNISKYRWFIWFSTFIFASAPLLLYFSQNVMQQPLSLFFCLLGLYGLIRWKSSSEELWLHLFVVSSVYGVLTQFSFFIIPLIGLLSLSKLQWIQMLKNKMFWVVTGIMGLVTIMYYYLFSLLPFSHEILFKPWLFLDSDLWIISSIYLFSELGIVFMCFLMLGLFIFICLKYKNKSTWLYLLAVVFWMIISAEKLSFHSFYWYPLIPFFAYFAGKSCCLLIWMLKEKKLVKVLFFIGIFLSSVFCSINLYGTQFPGHDIAGNTIDDGGNVMHSGFQSYSVIWYSGNNGAVLPDTVEDVQWLEDNRNCSWIYLYYWMFDDVQSNKNLTRYIEDNYFVVQEGWLGSNAEQRLYYLLKRGGSCELFTEESSWFQEIFCVEYFNGDIIWVGE